MHAWFRFQALSGLPARLMLLVLLAVILAWGLILHTAAILQHLAKPTEPQVLGQAIGKLTGVPLSEHAFQAQEEQS